MTMPDIDGGRMGAQTIFILSPARTDGSRGRMLFDRRATSPLAMRLRNDGASLGEIYAFVSGLYFRGKLTYARAFERARSAPHGILVIAPGMGLVPPGTSINRADLRTMAAIGVAPGKRRFREPLERDAAALAHDLADEDRVVLLGSIATDKYIDALRPHLGERLYFPAQFVGRGDMSRGGLMLRHASESCELEYLKLDGAVRRGRRPPRLSLAGAAIGAT